MSNSKEKIDFEKLTILVVDDMKSMRLTVRKMLKSLHIGTDLYFAENGRDGLKVLRQRKCDLAIVDWNMPVMNGIQMLEEVRNDPALRDTPVIMVTAEAERDIVAEVAEVEVDGYLLKPLTLQSLDQKIKMVVEKISDPDPFTTCKKKARDLEDQGDFDGAIAQVRKALKIKPNASRMLRQMGLLHFKIKKNKVAEKCLLKAVSVNPQDVTSRVYLADYYLKMEDIERAGKYYLEVLRLSGRYNDRAFDIGKKLLRRGLKSIAFEIFSKVLYQSKKQNEARDKIIEICLENSEYEFPKGLLEMAVKENSANYDAVFKLGKLMLENHEWEKALSHFETVDNNVRGHVDAKMEIARIYYMNRKIFKADDYLNQILRIDPKHEEALQLRSQI